VSPHRKVHLYLGSIRYKVSEMSLWREASPEESKEIIEKIAKKVVGRELDFPATLFLGAIRLLSPLGGQLVRFFLAPWTPLLGDLPYEYISVLEKPENILKLINRINELVDETEEEKKRKKEEKKETEKGKNTRRWYHFW